MTWRGEWVGINRGLVVSPERRVVHVLWRSVFAGGGPQVRRGGVLVLLVVDSIVVDSLFSNWCAPECLLQHVRSLGGSLAR